MRSGLRLLGKRKRGSPDELDANTGTVTHNGMELSRGTWILLQDGASQIIARIDSFRAIHILYMIPYCIPYRYKLQFTPRGLGTLQPRGSGTFGHPQGSGTLSPEPRGLICANPDPLPRLGRSPSLGPELWLGPEPVPRLGGLLCRGHGPTVV